MKLIAATNNQKKLKELREILGQYFDCVLSLQEAGIEHETVEDGTTFAENALKKAVEAAEISGCAVVADDSGLAVDALGGAPGVYSARYSGVHGDDRANIDLLLNNMRGVANRKAQFVCALAFVCGGDRRVYTGVMQGEITHECAGDGGFGYDPVFYLPQYGCTSAQLSPQQKNAISHRGKAIAAFVQDLKLNPVQGEER